LTPDDAVEESTTPPPEDTGAHAEQSMTDDIGAPAILSNAYELADMLVLAARAMGWRPTLVDMSDKLVIANFTPTS
jgi:hypothetical protein